MSLRREGWRWNMFAPSRHEMRGTIGDSMNVDRDKGFRNATPARASEASAAVLRDE